MMMKNYDQSVEINHNPNWPYIPDHSYKILIVRDSGSGKTNVLLNLVKHQRSDIDKVYLCVKDPFDTKYQLFINRKNPKAFNDYLQTTDDAYEDLEDYNPTKKKRVFDDMITDTESNKKLSSIVTELFLREIKLIILLAFTSFFHQIIH